MEGGYKTPMRSSLVIAALALSALRAVGPGSEIHPERLMPRPASHGPHLDRVTVDGRALPIGGLPWPAVVIPGGARRVDFSLSSSAQRPRALRYRLVGLDSAWIVDDRFGLTLYTFLDPGSYRLEVSLRDEQGRWSKPSRLAEIEVQPRFYERPAFAALAVLALLAVAAGMHQWAERGLRRRAAALEALVGQRTEELREANRQLEALATSDPLTGLANRRLLEGAMEKEIRRARCNSAEISLLMIDIDFFKSYNDNLGHVSGDECLRQVGIALRSATVGSGDVVARYGGEEFAVLLPETTVSTAARIAESLRQAVQELAIPHPASPVAGCVTISVGVVGLVPAAEVGPAQMIALADAALYRAKQEGRNRVLVADYERLG
jgi:diguanylate cyclase (GGDEF)-like protein